MNHGTNSGYAQRCRCARCREAHRLDTASRRRSQLHSGEPSRTSAVPYRALLRRLTLPEYTLAEVSLATGIALGTLESIRRGDSTLVNRRTREALRELVMTLPTEQETG